MLSRWKSTSAKCRPAEFRYQTSRWINQSQKRRWLAASVGCLLSVRLKQFPTFHPSIDCIKSQSVGTERDFQDRATLCIRVINITASYSVARAISSSRRYVFHAPPCISQGCGGAASWFIRPAATHLHFTIAATGLKPPGHNYKPSRHSLGLLFAVPVLQVQYHGNVRYSNPVVAWTTTSE